MIVRRQEAIRGNKPYGLHMRDLLFIMNVIWNKNKNLAIAEWIPGKPLKSTNIRSITTLTVYGTIARDAIIRLALRLNEKCLDPDAMPEPNHT